MVIGIGVTGSGFMGRTHVDAASKLDATRPVAVSGGRRAAALAADYQMQVEPDIESLVARDDVQAIVIATPHHLHCDEAVAAATAGKHVLVEKPMATSLKDCDRMTREFAERKLVLAVGYHQRFRESNRTVRDLIAADRIGPVRCIQMSALFDITRMRNDSGFGGNWEWWTDPRSLAHLINSGPHNIDLCRWWLQADLRSVTARCGTFRETNPNENTTMALMGFSDNTMATFWSSSVLPAPGFDGEDFRFRIMGDRGIIDHNPYGEVRLGLDGESQTVYQQPAVGHDDSNAAFQMNRMQAYCDQLQAFVDAIEGKSSEVGSAADGRAAVAGVLGMLESSATDLTVTVS